MWWLQRCTTLLGPYMVGFRGAMHLWNHVYDGVTQKDLKTWEPFLTHSQIGAQDDAVLDVAEDFNVYTMDLTLVWATASRILLETVPVERIHPCLTTKSSEHSSNQGSDEAHKTRLQTHSRRKQEEICRMRRREARRDLSNDETKESQKAQKTCKLAGTDPSQNFIKICSCLLRDIWPGFCPQPLSFLEIVYLPIWVRAWKVIALVKGVQTGHYQMQEPGRRDRCRPLFLRLEGKMFSCCLCSCCRSVKTAQRKPACRRWEMHSTKQEEKKEQGVKILFYTECFEHPRVINHSIIISTTLEQTKQVIRPLYVA